MIFVFVAGHVLWAMGHSNKLQDVSDGMMLDHATMMLGTRLGQHGTSCGMVLG